MYTPVTGVLNMKAREYLYELQLKWCVGEMVGNDLKHEWDSSVPRVQEQVDRLCVHPQPPDPVPPPGLAGVYGNGRA